MNKAFLSVLVAVAFAGPALAQTVGLVGVSTQGDGYMADEPNVQSGGSLPYANHPTDNRVTTYPADSNGIGPAKQGTPSTITGARYYARDYVTGDLSFTHVDYNQMLAPFVGGDFLIPGHGHFTAWHGVWADLNQDGFITDPEFTGDPLFFSVNGRDCGGSGIDNLGVDEDGNVTSECTGADEWAPLTDGAVVGYITPYVPVESLPSNSIGNQQTRSPDLLFSETDNGRYFAPSSNWDVVFVDNSFLQTTVTEIYNNPDITSDGPRSQIPSAASKVDTDIYRSVDPAVEALYQTLVLAPLAAEDCDVDHPESGECPSSVTSLIPTVSPSEAYDPLVGPAQGAYFPAYENEGTSAYAAAPHLYFDVRLAISGHSAAIYTAGDGDDPQDGPANGVDAGGSISHTGDGGADAPFYAGVYGVLGAWFDANGDGFIGAPTPTVGCPDAYNCGANQDANDYTDEDEWTPACRPVRLGEILGSLTSSTGTWGAGVYVTTDRADATDPEADEYASDGRVAFNPYDDAVLDAADTSIDQLFLSGPIPFHLVCSDPAGSYASYEHFVFLSSNQGFDVTVATTPFDMAFTAAGIGQPETLSDTDTYASWTI